MLWEVGLFEFLLVTVALGGGAAWLTGRAIALSWLPFWQLTAYMVLLAGAARFIHFALFGGSLLAPWYYAVDLAVLMAFAAVSKRLYRARLMATQYNFAFERLGPFSWRRRPIA